MTENDVPKPPKKEISPWEALGLVWDLLLLIAIPTSVLALLGRWLDGKFGSSPIFLIVMLVLALGISALIAVKKGKRIAKKL